MGKMKVGKEPNLMNIVEGNLAFFYIQTNYTSIIWLSSNILKSVKKERKEKKLKSPQMPEI